MKCIKLTSLEIVRVEDVVAHEAVKQGVAIYASKEKWKAQGRKYLSDELQNELIKAIKENKSESRNKDFEERA